MKKLAPIFVSLLAACGEAPEIEPAAPADTAQIGTELRTPEVAEAESEIAKDSAPADIAALAPAHLDRTGIDCGTVIPLTAGEYVLSEVSHMEAIDRSGCTYFAGDVRVAFTVPLVPTAQKPLFSPGKITEITGRITQSGKLTGTTTQTVVFTGLERAGRIEATSGQGCPFPALKSVGSVYLSRASAYCSLPALTDAGQVEIKEATEITGFNALTSVGTLKISGGSLKVSGFKKLVDAGAISLSIDLYPADKWTGSFPALVTASALQMKGITLKEFSIPKLTTVTGNLSIESCGQTWTPFKVLKEIGGSLTVEERTTVLVYTHRGPASLTSVGGSIRIKSAYGEVVGYTGLKTVGGSVSVSADLHEVNAFDALTSVGSLDLDLTSTEIHGFKKLATVNGSVRIKNEGFWGSTQPSDAFPVLTEIGGALTITLGGRAEAMLPKLRSVGGAFKYEVLDEPSYTSIGPSFDKVESVGGSLLVTPQASGYNGLLSVGGTLSITDVAGSGLSGYYIRGFRKVSHVGGDLILDKNVPTYGTNGTQRLLDQLIGFTGNIIVK